MTPALEGIPFATAEAFAARRRRNAVRWVVVAAVVVFLLGLGFVLSEVFNPLLLGLLLAYVLNPIVEALERRGLSRDRSVVVLFVVTMVLFGSLLAFGAVKTTDHLDDLLRAISGERILDRRDPDDVATLAAAGGQGVRLDSVHSFVDEDGDGKRKVGLAEQVTAAASEHLGAHLSPAELMRLGQAYQVQAASLLKGGVALGQGLRRSLEQVGTWVGFVLLVPLYTFFLLQSFSRLRERIRDHLPGAYRARIVEVARKVDRQVAAFFRGKLILAIIKGLVTSIGLTIADVPFAFLIGMGAGLLSVVPFLGPLCGAPLAIVLGWHGPEGFFAQLLGVGLSFGAAEVVEAVAQPVILGREVGLSPLALILSLFVFGELFGFFGVLLAVPIACVVKILFAELILPEIQALAREPGPPVPPDLDPAATVTPSGLIVPVSALAALPPAPPTPAPADASATVAAPTSPS
jgi:predicted PurR-regulated permease PerM